MNISVEHHGNPYSPGENFDLIDGEECEILDTAEVSISADKSGLFIRADVAKNESGKEIVSFTIFADEGKTSKFFCEQGHPYYKGAVLNQVASLTFDSEGGLENASVDTMLEEKYLENMQSEDYDENEFRR